MDYSSEREIGKLVKFQLIVLGKVWFHFFSSQLWLLQPWLATILEMVMIKITYLKANLSHLWGWIDTWKYTEIEILHLCEFHILAKKVFTFVLLAFRLLFQDLFNYFCDKLKLRFQAIIITLIYYDKIA